MLFRIVVAALTTWLAILPASTAAQGDQARIMGVVTDGSGGALPGVTVTVAGGNERPAPVVTDGAGRYLTAWLAPGAYSVIFTLSGFEARTVTKVQLGAGQTVVLDQQLGLAPLTETVQVTAVAPVPPPPPPPPPLPPVWLPRGVAPQRPQAKAVDPEILASVCGPRESSAFSLAIGRVVSHRDNADRRLLGPGDLLVIDAGEAKGVANGQNLVVRRRLQTGDLSFGQRKQQTGGEQTAGLVQIVEISPETSVAQVVHACGEIVAGDTVEPYAAQPAFFAVAAGTPRFDDPARITLGEHGQTASAAGQMMVIDRGIMQGVQRGMRLTIFRSPSGNPLLNISIGDGVIVAIRADSATIKIEKTTDAVMVGDLVALHR